MERSVASVFFPSRNNGIRVHGWSKGKNLTWSGGIFRQVDKFARAKGKRGYNFTGRLTYLPWRRDGGSKLLHLGIAYSHRLPPSRKLRLAIQPEAHLAPDFADTTTLKANAMDTADLEAALVLGAFSLQSELAASLVARPQAPNPRFFGFYTEVSYFLTGEHRSYDPAQAEFHRLHPARNFPGGSGALQLAARYSYLDLDSNGVRGGKLRNLTLGVNWYANPNVRLTLNYVFAHRQAKGSAHGFITRVQLEF
jgi:phosphate-selective porin OprO/OprP